MTTLRDVAARAGVSAMTVSNVVNGREHKVSAATSRRVREAIEALGYVPNAQARALAGASSRIIALLYGVGEGLPALTAEHESAFVGACERAARRQGYSLMLCGAGRDLPQETIERLRAWSVSAVISLGTVPTRVRTELTALEIPVVLVDSGDSWGTGGRVDDLLDPEGQAPFGAVSIDDAGGARCVGERLATLGHRRTAFIGPVGTDSPVLRDRLEGLREGLVAGGATRREARGVEVIEAEVGFEAGVRVGSALGGRVAAAGPGRSAVTGVLASGDVLAMGVVAGLRRAGVRVPEDVSVVGFDGFEVSTYCDPPLTTMAQSVEDKAERAVGLVHAALEEGEEPHEAAASGACGERDPCVRTQPVRVLLPVAWREGGTLGPAPG